MRAIYLLLLLVLVAAIAYFAFQNQSAVTVQFMNWAVTYPLSLVVAAVYLLGMLSGSTFVGLLRRTVHRVTERAED